MAGFLGKLFGGKKKADGGGSEAIMLVEDKNHEQMKECRLGVRLVTIDYSRWSAN